MIVIDLDGTLLNSHSEISAGNVKAIDAAIQHGFEVVIATGRGHFDVKDLLKTTYITPWIIGANGATIHKPDGRLFCSVPIAHERAVPVLKWLEENDYYYEVFSEHAIYTPENGRNLIKIELDWLQRANPGAPIEELRHSANQQFKQFGFQFVTGFKEIESKRVPVHNILAFSFDEEKLERGRLRFQNRNDLHVVSSGFHNFEIEDKNVSKGTALKRLTDELGIELKNTIVIGDSLNDLSMMKIAGVSVAMENAAQEVKQSCLYQTDSNDHEGVAKAIYQYILTNRDI